MGQWVVLRGFEGAGPPEGTELLSAFLRLETASQNAIQCVLPQFNENQPHLRPEASAGPRASQVAPSAGGSVGRGAAASWNEPHSHRREGGAPRASKTEMPLCKVWGHQYFMPLELSLFLCKLLGLPDGQGLAASSINQAVPSSPPCDCQGLAAWPRCGPSSPSLCTAATALSWTPGTEEARGQVAALGGSQVEGPHGGRGGSCHVSARLCSFLFNHNEPVRWAERGSCPSWQVKSPGRPAISSRAAPGAPQPPRPPLIRPLLSRDLQALPLPAQLPLACLAPASVASVPTAGP